jgi:hypothetical protein
MGYGNSGDSCDNLQILLLSDFKVHLPNNQNVRVIRHCRITMLGHP